MGSDMRFDRQAGRLRPDTRVICAAIETFYSCLGDVAIRLRSILIASRNLAAAYSYSATRRVFSSQVTHSF
jgi:hypothetical protein